jgi:signal recognition particle subunit SRP54
MVLAQLGRSISPALQQMSNVTVFDEGVLNDITRALLQSDVCKMLDPGKPCFTPKKGKTSAIMLVGLQGTLFIKLFSCQQLSHTISHV